MNYRITCMTGDFCNGFGLCRASSLAMAEQKAEEYSKEHPSWEVEVEYNEFDNYFYSDWQHVSTWKAGKEIMAQTRLN